MNKYQFNIRAIASICLCTYTSFFLYGAELFIQAGDSTIKSDTLVPYKSTSFPNYNPSYRYGDIYSEPPSKSSINLIDPTSLDLQVDFDTSINFTATEQLESIDFRPPINLSFKEYDASHTQKLVKDYWREQAIGLEGESAIGGRRLIPKLYISPVFDRIFGGSYVDITPTGFVNLDFGGLFQYNDNPQIPERQRKNGGFNFNMQISSNVVGKIGDKLAVTFNFDNNNSFDFQNDMKIDYTGYEEEIIKKIELGNVSMPISNSLISGAQSLFGVKTQLQFGKLYVTGIASRQQGRNEIITLEDGVDERQFELQASNYDENRHFFLSHFFRENYENWLGGLPQVISGINVTRVEVYVLNRNNNTATTRNFISLMDLGEGSVVYNPSIGSLVGGASRNGSNDLYQNLISLSGTRNPNLINELLESNFGMTESTDFVKVTTARKLDLTEYNINKELGYVSLIRKLQNDEVLAVSYEYTYNGQVYKVGELSEDYQGFDDDELIFLKMLRPNKINTRIPTWDLMMKNIYNLNAGQVQQDGFTLRIHYRDDLTGIDNPSLHEGRLTRDTPLVQLLGLDQLNRNNDRQKDGNFDYVEGITINSKTGIIIFPVLEPFGPKLKSYFDDSEFELIDKYVYDTLYRTTKADAAQIASKNKFFILGKYSGGSSSEISLPGINISPGSVVVMAGNTPLSEGLDYTVDYNLGRVRILNSGIMSSGKQIQISYEKADLFNFQTRWLTGTNFEYLFNDNFSIGATLLHLNERPGGKTRYAVGDEPTKNTKYGFNLNYQTDSRLLTQIVDAMPFISTKEKSSVSFSAEFAQLIPGTSNLVEGEGTSYLDDFENALTYGGNLQSWAGWNLASTPSTSDDRFEVEDVQGGDLGTNYKRAKLAWYTVDNSVFYTSIGNRRPSNLKEDDLENHYERIVYPQEIHQQQDRTMITTNETILDIAYFPSERGPYNYNPNLDADGLLPNPEENWGGITNHINNEVDFDKTNIEFIEFWMMDPFIGFADGNPKGIVLDGRFNEHNKTGGSLIFNLGSVSEDYMKDGRHAFENGLPADGDLTNASATEWGYITEEQFLTNQFENSQGSRANQDVGLDGLRNDLEAAYFQSYIDQLNVAGLAREEILADPSGDNFQYYLDDAYDQKNAKVVERYKNYNGQEGNSPVTSSDFSKGNSPAPDNEDISRDNTVSGLEEYYEYKIDLRPGNLEVGKENIVDQVMGKDGEATWYLFRVPIKNPDKIVGAIEGFKSMQYARMYLTDFSQPVVLRMSSFRLIGNKWRKYQGTLFEEGFNEVPEITTSDFQVSVVNVEENSIGNDESPPYVIPPGLSRDRDNTTFLNRRDNEQSLQVCVEDLPDKDSRAVFKGVSYDLINYGRLKMFFSAHAYQGDDVSDDEVSAFLRFGTDYSENYYEIELPLKITPTTSGLSGEAIRRVVWPEENEIDLTINEILALKSERNRTGLNVQVPYTKKSKDGKYDLTIKGRPELSTILTMMIGMRNLGSDDLQDKSICLWVNELRVTDFDSQNGWAANARVNAKLADLGTFSASTRYTSNGFGSIQQRISERTREEQLQYDINASINFDKFLFPEKTGLKIPIYASIEQSRATPKFDPLDPDIPLEASLESFDTQVGKDDYLALVQDRSTRRSLNFTNVRKEKVKSDAKVNVYDIENFSFSYAFSDQNTTNISTQKFYRKTTSAGLSYNYSPEGFSIEPFAKSEILGNPFLKIIKDINFSILPTSLTFRGDLNRNFVHTQLYNAQLTTAGMDPYYERLFSFNRNYGLRWNFFKALSFDYSVRVNAVIDESDDFVEGDITTSAERDYILDQILNLGRMKNYNQNASLNLKLPFDKIPITDWISSDVRYAVSYGWVTGSLNQEDSLGNSFGNIINNSSDKSLTGKIDMVKLYNKVPFFKTINTPSRSNRSSSSAGKRKDETETSLTSSLIVGKGILRILMAIRSINFNYGIKETTNLSGFLPAPNLFGMDSLWSAPGWGFLFGEQDAAIRFTAAEQGWITQTPLLTSPFMQSSTRNLSFNASIEPFKGLKIQLNGKRTSAGRYQEIFRYNSEIQEFGSLTPSRSGSYSISYLTIKSAFEAQIQTVNGVEFETSPAFDQFKENIDVISGRLSNSLESRGISDRYDTMSQDILVPAFLAAYTGENAENAPMGVFPQIPIPNWRIDFAGLSKLPGLKNVFSSVNLTHSYRSIFNVNNYTNSLLYTEQMTLDNQLTDYPLASLTDSITGKLVPVYILNQVSILEQFAPLIGINVKTKTNLSASFNYKRDRNLALNLSNAQVTETQNSGVTFDFGWTKADLILPFKTKGRTITIKNDVTFRMAITFRDSKTVQRKLQLEEEGTENKITNGNKGFQIRPSVAYKLNKQLDLTMYYEKNTTTPRVGSYLRSTTSFGIQLRFNLAQ